jgi:transcriptional regulator GlxA family with amidase domain
MTSSQPRLVVFPAYDGMRLLDLTGPLDAFALTNDLHASDASAPYALRVVTVDGGPVRTSSGLLLLTEPLAALDDVAIDTLIVAGGAAAFRADSNIVAIETWVESQGKLMRWIASHGSRARRICSVCTGTFVLAAVGLLSERTVATHWESVRLLGNCFPRLRVDRDRIFIHDGPVWTSGGVTAGIDLALALIEDDLGSERALQVARVMVMSVTRPGGQAQYTIPFAGSLSDHDDFAALHTWLLQHLADDLRIEELATQAAMSRRTFMRSYTVAIGRTPAKTIETMRIDAARVALEATGKTLKEIAREAGFGTEDRMRRAFRRRLGVSASDYRLRFSLRDRSHVAMRAAIPGPTRPD